MSCTVSELPSGCRLRGMGAVSQNTTGGTLVSSVGGGGGVGGTNAGGIHVGGLLSTTSALSTRSGEISRMSATSANILPESGATTSQRQQQSNSSNCCLCWCFCCSCSWGKCLAIKHTDDSAANKRDGGSTDLLLDGEQPSLEEIRSWGKSFDKLMKSATGRKVFRDFLRSEFSEENILFWLACEELKNETSPEAIEEKARLIYEDYISILSPREVSLDSRVREIVNRNMVEPTEHTFDEAQIQIYTLMHRDSYPRFLNSQKFKSLAQLDSLSAAGSTADSPP